MKTLKTDLSILKDFEFEYAPVGVKFLYLRPEGMEQLNKTLPFCQMVREAQERGTPFYFSKENEDCFGTMTLGMVDVPPLCGGRSPRRRLRDLRGAESQSEDLPRCQEVAEGDGQLCGLLSHRCPHLRT